MKAAVSQDYLKLVQSMIISQDAYILARIKDNNFKEGYCNRMQVFLSETNICLNFEAYNRYLTSSETRFAVKMANIGFFNKFLKKNELEGEKLAIEVVSGIVASINERFIEGGHKLYESLLNAEDYRVKKK